MYIFIYLVIVCAVKRDEVFIIAACKFSAKMLCDPDDIQLYSVLPLSYSILSYIDPCPTLDPHPIVFTHIHTQFNSIAI